MISDQFHLLLSFVHYVYLLFYYCSFFFFYFNIISIRMKIVNVVKFFFSDFRSFEFLVPEDLSIARIAGLSWDQWSSQIGLPLVTQLREGIHPLLFPTDLTINPIASVFDDKKSIKLLSPVSILF